MGLLGARRMPVTDKAFSIAFQPGKKYEFVGLRRTLTSSDSFHSHFFTSFNTYTNTRPFDSHWMFDIR